MKSTTQPNVSEFIGQAAQTIDAAMQAGIQFQKEATRWWSDMFQGVNPIQNVQNRAQSMTEIMPNARKNVEQYLSLIGRGYQTGMNLMRRAIQAGQSTSYAEAQNNMRSFWEESFGALRANAEELAKINMRIMETWTNMNYKEAMEEAEAATIAGEKAALRAAAIAPKAARPGEGRTQRRGGARPRTRAARPRGNK